MKYKEISTSRRGQALLYVLLALGLSFGYDWFQRQGGKLEGHPRVIDGDSLSFGAGEVRLKGIDAPEGRQMCMQDGREWPCGEEARRELQRLIGGDRVVCRSVETDQHGRHLAYCEAGGRRLNSQMVRQGFAVDYGRDFHAEEIEARQHRRGIWAGEFERPREWRDKHPHR